jgi:hypothetical protein
MERILAMPPDSPALLAVVAQMAVNQTSLSERFSYWQVFVT